MNIYIIYVNPTKKNYTDFVIIKEGFSLIASFFNILWTLYHKMWTLLIITLLFHIVSVILHIDDTIPFSKIILGLIFGFFATDIREYYLEQKNYQLQDIILASSTLEAELKFLERSNQENYVR